MASYIHTKPGSDGVFFGIAKSSEGYVIHWVDGSRLLVIDHCSSLHEARGVLGVSTAPSWSAQKRAQEALERQSEAAARHSRVSKKNK
jgi:hypothetical protein